MKKILGCLVALAGLLIVPSCFAQGSTGGLLYASDFSQWTLPQGIGPANGTIAWTVAQVCQALTTTGYGFTAPKVGRPLRIIDNGVPAHSETVTPSSVTVGPGGCSINAPMSYSHLSYSVKSGTAGLQEAIDYQAGLPQGAVVILTPQWTLAGGTTAMILAAQGNVNVSILDQRNSNLQSCTWGGSAYACVNFGGGSQSNLNIIPITQYGAVAGGPAVANTTACNAWAAAVCGTPNSRGMIPPGSYSMLGACMLNGCTNVEIDAYGAVLTQTAPINQANVGISTIISEDDGPITGGNLAGGTGTVTLSGFNNGCVGSNVTATIANAGTFIGATFITNTAGTSCTFPPSTSSCAPATGTATCSGTVNYPIGTAILLGYSHAQTIVINNSMNTWWEGGQIVGNADYTNASQCASCAGGSTNILVENSVGGGVEHTVLTNPGEAALTVYGSSLGTYAHNTITGLGSNTLYSGGGVIPPLGNYAFGISVGDATGCYVNFPNNSSVNYGNQFINNTITLVGTGMFFANCDDQTLVANNVISKIVGQHGMYLDGINNLTITNNTIVDVVDNGIKFNPNFSGLANALVTGNTISIETPGMNIGSGIGVTTSNCNTPFAQVMSNIDFEGNLISGFAEGGIGASCIAGLTINGGRISNIVGYNPSTTGTISSYTTSSNVVNLTLSAPLLIPYNGVAAQNVTLNITSGPTFLNSSPGPTYAVLQSPTPTSTSFSVAYTGASGSGVASGTSVPALNIEGAGIMLTGVSKTTIKSIDIDSTNLDAVDVLLSPNGSVDIGPGVVITNPNMTVQSNPREDAAIEIAPDVLSTDPLTARVFGDTVAVNPPGVASINSTAGTPTGGTLGGSGAIQLYGFNNGCVGTTAVGTISSGSWTGSTFTVPVTGAFCTSPPTTATCANGLSSTATCSGTITFPAGTVVLQNQATPTYAVYMYGSAVAGTTIPLGQNDFGALGVSDGRNIAALIPPSQNYLLQSENGNAGGTCASGTTPWNCTDGYGGSNPVITPSATLDPNGRASQEIYLNTGGGPNGESIFSQTVSGLPNPHTSTIVLKYLLESGGTTTFRLGNRASGAATNITTLTATGTWQTQALTVVVAGTTDVWTIYSQYADTTATADILVSELQLCENSGATPCGSYITTTTSAIDTNIGKADTANRQATTGSNGTFWGVSGGVQGWFWPSSAATTFNAGDVICASGGDTTILGTAITGGTSNTLTVASVPNFFRVVGAPVGVIGTTATGGTLNTSGTAYYPVISWTTTTLTFASLGGTWSSGGSIFLGCINTSDAISNTTEAWATNNPFALGSLLAGSWYTLVQQWGYITPATAPTFIFMQKYGGSTIFQNNSPTSLHASSTSIASSAVFDISVPTTTQITALLRTANFNTATAEYSSVPVPTTATSSSASAVQTGGFFSATGLASATYSSGGTACTNGTQNVTFSTNGGILGTITVSGLVPTGTITLSGTGYGFSGSTAVGQVATCTGTTTFNITLGGAKGSAMVLLGQRVE